MSSVVIREADMGDAPVISEMEQECFSDSWSINSVLSQLSQNFYKNYVIESEGKTAGYLFTQFIEPEGEIFRIAVKKEYRRLGLGEKLLAFFFESQKVKFCFLEVRESNAAAIGLYEKTGFRIISRRKNYYKNPSEDALILRREDTEA